MKSCFDLQRTSKENVPLALESETKRLTPQLNQILTISKKIMCIDEALELVRDVIKRGTYSLRKFSRSWKISLNSFLII
jgi:hypothetical protein